jgi:parallel beta-helix repeat protein
MERKFHVKKNSIMSALFAVACFSLLVILIGCAGFSSYPKGSSPPPTAKLSISGTISPAAGGSSATVTINNGLGSETTTTDSAGNYSFSGLASGSYTVIPRKSGYHFTPASQNTTLSTTAATGVNFTAAQSTGATYSISGTIGSAVNGSGATITLSGAANATTIADSSGNYSFSGLSSGSYTVTPSKSGFTFNPTNLGATITTTNVTGVNFTASPVVTPTYSISGTISSVANGSGATVTLSGAANATTIADSSGNYSFSGLSSGSYTVTPSKSGFTFNPTSLGATITTTNVTGVNFTASPVVTPTYSISGTISSAANGSGATVTLSGAAGATTTADSSGNYSFSGLKSGTYTVTPSKSGFTFNPTSLGTTITNANVTGMNFTASPVVTPTYSISGTISSAANGSGATVILSGTANATTTADSSGNYSFSGLKSGTYNVTPSKSGFTFSPNGSVVPITNANVTGINFTASPVVTPTYSISGTITPSTNGSGATVRLSGAASATTTTDNSGNYSFSGLHSGSYTVTPSKAGFGFGPTNQGATITTANVTGVNFTASPAIAGGVNIFPGDDIPNIVNANPGGTTFVIYPGTYRINQPIYPKDGDSFIGQTECAPPANTCPAIISGSIIIGSLAVFDGTNYKVTGQTQQGATGSNGICDTGWEGCIYPEDLFFDGVPYKHLYSSTLPAIGPGEWWFDYATHVIYFHDNPAGHTVETSVQMTAFNGGANNVNIQYLTVKEFANMYPNGAIGVFQENTPLITGANWTIQNSEILLNHGAGVRSGYGIQILNNYIHDNGQLGVGGGIGVTSVPSLESVNANILIQGNTINHNNYARFNPVFGSGGFKIGSTSGVTLRGNTIQNNEGSGVHFDQNSQNALVDGNTITDNNDADGLQKEISYGTSTFRNNIVLRNGTQILNSNSTFQIAVRASSGVSAYCNVMEIPNASGVSGWAVIASNRGSSSYPPYQYLKATGNSFHHNTVLWDAGASGVVGFFQGDAANQPNFFADNPVPDYSAYHVNSMSSGQFVYDNNNSQSNTGQIFPNYQSNGADVHGTADTNSNNGYPTVSITSPSDQSTVGSSMTVSAAASDGSGIDRVEFYLDWNLQGTVTSTPYSYNMTSSTTGSHIVAAMAYSTAGIRSCYAITVNEQ